MLLSAVGAHWTAACPLPAPLMRKLRELERGEFLERAENALAFGLPGVGKSHAACAIGNALILTTRGDSYRTSKRKADTDNRSPPSNKNTSNKNT